MSSRQLLWILSCASLIFAQDEAQPLTGWTYQVAARPLSDQYADPGGRLNDGDNSRTKTAIWRGGSVSVDLDLAGPCQLDRVEIYQFRHNLNYKLDHLSVQAERAGEWVEVATVRGFDGPTPSMAFKHDLALGGVSTEKLRLHFAGVGVLSLSEVTLFGRRVEATSAAGAYANVPFQDAPGPSAREEDLDGDGKPEVVLENQSVRLVFAPSQGGVCRSLRLKPNGPELVYSEQPGYGLLRDQLWQPNYSFADRFYFSKLENSGKSASVELWTTGTGGMMSFTTIRKKITLGADGPVAEVHYTLTNEPSSQTDYDYGFWSHNWLGVTGRANTYTFPTVTGVQQFTLDPKSETKGDDLWFREPSRGWTAVTTDQGDGLCLLVPYRYLNLFYTWHGKASPAATHEWRLNLLNLKAGEQLEFDCTLIPFKGMPPIAGVADRVLAGLTAEADGTTVKARIRAIQAVDDGRTHLVRWALLDRDGNELPPVDQKPLPLGYGGLLNSANEWPDLVPGGYRICLIISRDGQEVGRIETPVSVGGARYAYRMEPESEQEGRKEVAAAAQRPAHQISTAVETPHIPWAKPFAGGRLKALVLMDDLNCREAVEFAQRLDLELDYTKYRTTFDKELLYQGDLSILTLDAAQQHLQQKLVDNAYDLLVLCGFNWMFHFSEANREAILQQVRRGAGLMLVQPDGFDEATTVEVPAAGVAKEKAAARSMGLWFRWQSEADHPLTAGLDWSLFPRTRRHEYQQPPQGEVIATIGDDHQPLVTLGKLGRGRVVSLTYDVLTHSMSYRGYSGLTPILSYRGGWLLPEYNDLPEGYQEPWFALLTRLGAWAAGRETGVRVTQAVAATDLSLLGGTVIAGTVQADEAKPGCQLELWLVDPLTGKITHQGQPLELKAGETKYHLPVPKLPAGDWLAGVIVRDPAGASLAWGDTRLHVVAPATITELTVTPETLLPKGGVWQEDTPVETAEFQPDQPIHVAVKLDQALPPTTHLQVTLSDARGRVLWQGRNEVPKATEAELDIPAQPLVHQGLQVEADLVDGDRVVARKAQRIVAYRPRVWNRFWYTSWEGNWLWRTHYLFDFNSKLIRDWGLDVAFWGDNELGTGKVRDNAYWDIDHSWLGLLGYLGQGVPDFMDRDFGKKAKQYAETKDKQYLQRHPSLVDSAWREAVKAKLVERVQRTMPAGGTYDYCMGDEMSLTYYTQFHDFDWSPESLAEFRQWLRRRYPDLKALNQRWGSTFATWEQVVPLTLDEAKETGNPSPWAEFRLYMNDQLADFYSFVQETIRSVDPHAKAGLSGTQSPEAGNGMDWWKVGGAFSYFHSYNTSWSNEMRRSFQKYGGGEQSPYFSGYSAVNPWAENRMWWCLFHDTRGISAWKTGLFFWGEFDETQSGRDTKAHLDTFRGGLWRLLRTAKRQHDGLAIYYSMPSIIATALTGEGAQLNAARDTWVKLLEDSGLQYDFVAAEQVADGLLEKSDYKVVVLPYTIALSKAECDQLRRFVERGGTLLATLPVAQRDELSRPQTPGTLDDLFGCHVEGEAKPLEAKVTLNQAVGDVAVGTELRLPVAVSNLQLNGAEALATAGDGVPVLTVGAKGHAVLLNLDLTHYEQERRFHSPVEQTLRAVLGELLAKAGVRPPYPVTLASGKPPQIEEIRYRNGEVEYLCLLNGWSEDDVATIELGAERQVYDLRAEADRGRMRQLKVPLGPGCARVYALTGAPLPKPTVSASDAKPGQAATVTVGLSAKPTAVSVVRLEVTDPQGQVRPDYRQTIRLTGEAVQTTIPFALNDPAGAWRLKATNVAGGGSSEVVLTVR